MTQLVPGLYVHHYGQGTFADPVVPVGRCLASAEILSLASQGVEWVYVDDSQACPVVPVASAAAAQSMAVYHQTLGYVRTFMDNLRAGLPADIADAAPFIGQVVDECLADARLGSIAKLKEHDEYTYTHSLNVCIFSVIFARFLGFPTDALQLVGAAGMFHDAGKARIPLEILNKPGKLTDNEFAVMRSHARLGHDLLTTMGDVPKPIRLAALEHHERFAGQGYPDHKKGSGLGPTSVIVSICDVYDAMTANRIYQRGRSPSEVLAQMYGWRGKDFAPKVVEQFIKCMGIYPEGMLVELSDQRLAVITRNNPDHLLHPAVVPLVAEGGGWSAEDPLDLAVEEQVTIVRALDAREYGIDCLAYL